MLLLLTAMQGNEGRRGDSGAHGIPGRRVRPTCCVYDVIAYNSITYNIIINNN